MRITYDPEKYASNLLKHGVDFDLAERFEWDTALLSEFYERDYKGTPEPRCKAFGYIQGRLYALVFLAARHETETLRIISLRKANNREKKHYESARSQRV